MPEIGRPQRETRLLRATLQVNIARQGLRAPGPHRIIRAGFQRLAQHTHAIQALQCLIGLLAQRFIV